MYIRDCKFYKLLKMIRYFFEKFVIWISLKMVEVRYRVLFYMCFIDSIFFILIVYGVVLIEYCFMEVGFFENVKIGKGFNVVEGWLIN